MLGFVVQHHDVGEADRLSHAETHLPSGVLVSAQNGKSWDQRFREASVEVIVDLR